MQGRIIKGIAGFYYVADVVEFTVYECKARGVFRKDKQKPLVGDFVEYEVLNEEEKTGNITAISERTTELIRPAVANVDQVLIVFAVKEPAPHYNLLDRFLVMMERQDVPAVLVFNKCDLASEAEMAEIRGIYEPAGYRVIFTSTVKDIGIDEIREVLKGKTTAVAGPSGVGKSSLTNCLQTDILMETGEISRKIERGKHTTRHSEVIPVEAGTWIMDTPGFSSLYAGDFRKEELKQYFPEFGKYLDRCRFNGCNHVSEPDCAVKAAVEAGEISRVRYQNYLELFQELEQRRR